MAQHQEQGVCDFCHEEHPTEADAIKCEHGHAVVAVGKTHARYFMPSSKYPEEVTITFYDGKVMSYIQNMTGM